jgi:thiamine biosynthesis lipoprotein
MMTRRGEVTAMQQKAKSNNEGPFTKRCLEGHHAGLGDGSDSGRGSLSGFVPTTYHRPVPGFGTPLQSPIRGLGTAASDPTPPGGDSNSGLLELRFPVMSTQGGIWLESSHARAMGAVQEARGLAHLIEHRLSRFRPDSELCRLNAMAGLGPRPVSRWLFGAVQAGLQLARLSDGLIDPTVLPCLVRAGFGPGSPRGRVGFRAVWLEPKQQTIELEAGVTLDLGGVAKGWAADLLAARLSSYGPALVDLGGDLRAEGPWSWPIGVEHPLFPERDIAEIELRSEGVATSSVLKRRRGGNHHLIDPRTEHPAHTDLVAATVVAPTATMAEGAAKVTLLLGHQEGQVFLREAGLWGFLVKADGTVTKVEKL